MAAAMDWLEQCKVFWGNSFDQLDEVLADMKRAQAQEKKDV